MSFESDILRNHKLFTPQFSCARNTKKLPQLSNPNCAESRVTVLASMIKFYGVATEPRYFQVVSN